MNTLLDISEEIYLTLVKTLTLTQVKTLVIEATGLILVKQFDCSIELARRVSDIDSSEAINSPVARNLYFDLKVFSLTTFRICLRGFLRKTKLK